MPDVIVVDDTIGSESVQDQTSPVTFSGGDITINEGLARCLVVIITHEDAETDDVTNVTWNGNSLTKAVETILSTDTSEIWYGVEDILDANTASLILTHDGTEIGGLIWELIVLGNVNQGTPLGNINGATVSDDTSLSTTIATSSGSAVVDALILGESGKVLTIGPGQVTIYNVDEPAIPSLTGGSSYELHPIETTSTMSWTWSTSSNRAVLSAAEFLSTRVGSDTNVIELLITYLGEEYGFI